MHACNFVYKGVNNQLSKGVNGMFEYPNPREANNTKAIDQKHLLVPRSKLKVCKGNIRVRGAEYSNTVSLKTKLAPSYQAFKFRLKRDLF